MGWRQRRSAQARREHPQAHPRLRQPVPKLQKALGFPKEKLLKRFSAQGYTFDHHSGFRVVRRIAPVILRTLVAERFAGHLPEIMIDKGRGSSLIHISIANSTRFQYR
jgi:hypothetical protein